MSHHYSVFMQMRDELGRDPTPQELKDRTLEIIRAATKRQHELHELAKKARNKK